MSIRSKFLAFLTRRRGRTSTLQSVAPSGQIQPTVRLVAHKFRSEEEAPATPEPRIIERKQTDGLLLGEELVAHKIPGSRESTEAVRIADSGGLEVRADESPKRLVDYEIKGTSPQGETKVVEACRILIERLNQEKEGAPWGGPTDVSRVPGKEHLDCEAFDGAKTLNIQVTRAQHDPRLWRDLANSGSVAVAPQRIDEIADGLKEAITSKALRLPAAVRVDTVLAIDAMLTPGSGFQSVISSFRSRHGVWARELGFHGIWVVGPTARLTNRLDEP